MKKEQKLVVTIERLSIDNWYVFEDSIYSIEEDSYEAERQHSKEMINKTVRNTAGVSVVALIDNIAAGFCIGGPISDFTHLIGPSAEVADSYNEILYAADLCVAEKHRGLGVARQLKAAQIRYAKQEGYRLLAGRNRLGFADIMWRLNRSLGARPVSVINDAYNDDLKPNSTIYYHIKLR